MLHLRLIILSVGGDVPVDSETLLVIDFVNLKIKPVQSFKNAYRDRVCVRVFIEVNAPTCMRICIYTVFLKNMYPIFMVLNLPILNHKKIFGVYIPNC
jgi:hypothetical protein